MLRLECCAARRFVAVFIGGMLILALNGLPVFSPPAAAGEIQWWHKMVGATDKTQRRFRNGDTVKVGVLDGLAFGVNPNGSISYVHPDLRSRITGGTVWSRNARDLSNYSRIGDDHGTHVAGIVAATKSNGGIRGIAPKARVHSVGLFDRFGLVASTQAGLSATYRNGGSIANMSYGPLERRRLAFDRDLSAIIRHKGKLLVTKAAGNDGGSLKDVVCNGCKGANLANMIIVGAVDRDKKIARFSNKPGNACFRRSGRGCSNKDDDRLMNHFLVAPGVDIKSLDEGGGYDKKSGTSMAAPMVAGAAALLQSRWKFLKKKSRLTAKILLQTAEDLGREGPDSTFGRGLLRIDEAMQAQGQTRLVLAKNVKGASHETASVGLSPAFGGGQSVKNALRGVVVFDKYDRDFVVTPDSLVASAPSTFSLSQHFQNRYEAADRGRLVSGPVSESVSFTGLVPIDVVETAQSVTFSQRPVIKTSVASYLDYVHGENDSNAWRLDATMGDLSFSFGQNLGSLQSLAVNGSKDMFLFNSSLAEQPYVTLNDEAHFGYARYSVSESLGIGMGFSDSSLGDSTLPGIGQSRALMVQADYAATDRLGLQVSQSWLSEDESVLGGSAGAFGFDSGASTLSASMSLSYKLLPTTTARLHFAEGMTDTDPAAMSLFSKVDTLHSQAYGASLTHKGIFGRENDEIGISVSRPLRFYGGDAVMNVPVGRTVKGKVVYDERRVSWAPEDSQMDFDFGYRTRFGQNFSFGGNLFYQHNANDNPEDYNVGVLTRARFVY